MDDLIYGWMEEERCWEEGKLVGDVVVLHSMVMDVIACLQIAD